MCTHRRSDSQTTEDFSFTFVRGPHSQGACFIIDLQISDPFFDPPESGICKYMRNIDISW